MNQVFFNRTKELSFLESKWREPSSQFIVLWGKRRVGKTELVKHFIRNKPHIYFLSESTNEKEQLKRFSIAVGELFKEPLLKTRGFNAWEESFEYIKQKNLKFVLAIDEFPYLIHSNRGILSIFQTAWDEYWAKSNIYLILLGSSITMMENEVLAYNSPLYGRRTGQWKVPPMEFEAIKQFRNNKSFEDQIMHYAVAGGIPAYWKYFSSKKNIFLNIQDHVLTKGEVLYEETEFLLREELREPRYYFSILQAISQGKRKLSEIVNSTGIATQVANKYLSVLIDLNIIKKELPITEKTPLKSKKGLYFIADYFFNFWFQYVFPRKSELEMGKTELVLKNIIEKSPQYISLVYENVAQELLVKYADYFFNFSNIGKWWDKNNEIDIICFNQNSGQILFAEVKWTTKLVGLDILENLKQKAKKVIWGPENRQEYFCLFSKNGFTEALIKQAKQDNIKLFKGNILLN